MILPFTYWLLGISAAIILFGMWIKSIDETNFGVHIIAMGAMLLMFVGMDLLIFGVEHIRNISTTALGGVLLGVGFIMIITEYMKIYQEAF